MPKSRVQKRAGKFAGAITATSNRQRKLEVGLAPQLQSQTRREFLGAAEAPSTVAVPDTRPPFTPARLAGMLGWHQESVRRKLRKREWASVVVSRRRLVPAAEVDKIMAEGFIARAV